MEDIVEAAERAMKRRPGATRAKARGGPDHAK